MNAIVRVLDDRGDEVLDHRRRRAARPPVPGLAVRERPGRAGPRVDRRARGRGAAPGDGVRPRRSALALRGPVHARGPVLRRPRVPRRDAELPRLHRLRAGLARRPHGRRRVHRRRRRDGRAPRRPASSRRRSGAHRRGRLVLGRLHHADAAGPQPGPVDRGRRRGPGRRLRDGVPRTRRPRCRRWTARCSAGAPRSSPSATTAGTRSPTSTTCARRSCSWWATTTRGVRPRRRYAYVDRLAAREAPHQLYRFETGHGSHVTDEDVRQQRVIIDFLRANVPGLNDESRRRPGRASRRPPSGSPRCSRRGRSSRARRSARP